MVLIFMIFSILIVCGVPFIGYHLCDYINEEKINKQRAFNPLSLPEARVETQEDYNHISIRVIEYEEFRVGSMSPNKAYMFQYKIKEQGDWCTILVCDYDKNSENIDILKTLYSRDNYWYYITKKYSELDKKLCSEKAREQWLEKQNEKRKAENIKNS